jgi:hypothetical protein
MSPTDRSRIDVRQAQDLPHDSASMLAALTLWFWRCRGAVFQWACPIRIANLVPKNHYPLPGAGRAARQSRIFNRILIAPTAVSVTSARVLARFGPRSIPNTSRTMNWIYDGGS